jgi:hypothetical protein
LRLNITAKSTSILSLNTRQADETTLRDLPFAREEAAYVASKLGGELYINDSAQESVFKKRAPAFAILHLAMHTLINEVSPGYSKAYLRESRRLN